MYSLTEDAVKQGDEVIMITSDKDMGQIVGKQVMVYDWFKRSVFRSKHFEERFGFSVAKLPFYYSIIGVMIPRNIPSKNIGKVGATELVKQFESLDDMYSHLDQVKKERTRLLLQEQKDNAYLSHKLFLLRYHKIPLKKSDYAFKASNWPNARPLFEELEFKSLLKDLSKYGIEQPSIPLSQAKGYQFITVDTLDKLHDVVQQIHEKKLFCIRYRN